MFIVSVIGQNIFLPLSYVLAGNFLHAVHSFEKFGLCNYCALCVSLYPLVEFEQLNQCLWNAYLFCILHKSVPQSVCLHVVHNKVGGARFGIPKQYRCKECAPWYRIVERVVFHAVRIVSKEGGWLCLPRTSCNIIHHSIHGFLK
jgi:hypothetical protein